APRSFFCRQVAVVLRNRRFIHWRPEIRCVGQALREGVIRKKTQSLGITPPQVHIARVVPALRAVLQQVDRAHRKSLALNHRVGAARSQSRTWYKGKRFERTPWPKGAGSRQRVIDQMCALQMKTARAEITDFDRSISSSAFLQRSTPLLYVLRRRMRIKRGEAYRCRRKRSCAENWRAKIESRIEQCCRRREIIRLLRLRKNVGNVMALVTPRIHVNWRVENSVRRVQNQPKSREISRLPKARCEVVFVGKKQAIWVARLSADKDRWSAI